MRGRGLRRRRGRARLYKLRECGQMRGLAGGKGAFNRAGGGHCCSCCRVSGACTQGRARCTSPARSMQVRARYSPRVEGLRTAMDAPCARPRVDVLSFNTLGEGIVLRLPGWAGFPQGRRGGRSCGPSTKKPALRSSSPEHKRLEDVVCRRQLDREVLARHGANAKEGSV